MNTFAFGRTQTRPDNAILRLEKTKHWGELLLDIGNAEASPTGIPANHLTCYYVYDRTTSFDSSSSQYGMIPPKPTEGTRTMH
jgi:hypothetical protein